MKTLSRLLFLTGMLLIILPGASAQTSAIGDPRPAVCLAPLPFFEDFEDGFAVLRDGTKISGKIDIKDYEKSGTEIKVTSKEGKKYFFNTSSLKYFGLSINIPRNLSPLSLYDWKNEKRKATKGPERGFVVLMSGDTLDGKIQIEGRSSESPRAEGNFFAIEELTFTDKAGKETIYKRDQIKAFGRILPWELSPAEMWTWSKAFSMGKSKTISQPGFMIMNDGTRREGDMLLVVKNNLPKTPYNGGMDSQFDRDSKPKSKIYSDLVDEIWIKRDGKDEKVSTDDIYAFGLAGMTINTLTNKGSRLYRREEMNFHEGSVTTNDGKKVEGYLALRPYDNNYYAAYYAAKADDPIQIIPMKDIKSIVQDISLVEAFGEESAVTKANTNLNGHVVQVDGTRAEGTVKLVGDNAWWAKGIEFTDKEGHVIKFGGADQAISHAVIDNKIYVQYEDIFLVADRQAAPFALYPDPYPAKGSKFGQFAMGMAMDVASMAVGELAGAAMADAQRGGLDMSGVEIDGQSASGMAEPIPLYREDGSVGGYVQRTNAQNVIGSSVSGMALKAVEMNTDKKARAEGPSKSDKSQTTFIFNIDSRENSYASSSIPVYLGGCIEYHSLVKDEQKKLKEDRNAAVEFLNKCMAKARK